MNWKISPFTILLIVACLSIGIFFGMFIQQQIFIQGAYEFAQGLEGSTIELNIDLNTTIMVEKMDEILRDVLTTTGDSL